MSPNDITMPVLMIDDLIGFLKLQSLYIIRRLISLNLLLIFYYTYQNSFTLNLKKFYKYLSYI